MPAAGTVESLTVGGVYWVGMKIPVIGIAVVALAALIVGGVWYLRQPAGAPPAAPPAAPTVAAAPAAPPAPAAAASSPAYPIEAPAAAASGAAPFDPGAALAELFGRQALAVLQLQDVPRRVVATVDNLGREQAPSALWPVSPAAGRFTVQTRDGATLISPDNGLRYTPYVVLLENVDMARLAATYARMYPQLQLAYQDLGFPKRYFNDRLVEVIDQLLATPDTDQPVAVHLPSIAGAKPPQRPWVLYEFDDPAWQSLPAGQKMLLRMGPVNERRVKAKLVEFRRLITAGRSR